jgi:hypothetical protein
MAFRSQQHPLLNDRFSFQADAAPQFPVGTLPFGYCALLAAHAENHGSMRICAPTGTNRHISSISALVTAMQPSVQSWV